MVLDLIIFIGTLAIYAVLIYTFWPLFLLAIAVNAIIYINRHPDLLPTVSTYIDIAAVILIIIATIVVYHKYKKRHPALTKNAILIRPSFAEQSARIRKQSQQIRNSKHAGRYVSVEAKIASSGDSGELNVLHILKSIGNVIVYWSVGITSGHKKREIDIIAISPYGLLQIEIKNYHGRWICDDHEKIRRVDGEYSGQDGLKSPFKQIRQANMLLNKTLRHYLHEDIRIKPVVVFPNDSFSLQDSRENKIAYCLHDQIKPFFEEFVYGKSAVARPLDPSVLAKVMAALDHGDNVPVFFDPCFSEEEAVTLHKRNKSRSVYTVPLNSYGAALYELVNRMGLEDPCSALEGVPSLFCDSRMTNPNRTTEEERDLKTNPPYRVLPLGMRGRRGVAAMVRRGQPKRKAMIAAACCAALLLLLLIPMGRKAGHLQGKEMGPDRSLLPLLTKAKSSPQQQAKDEEGDLKLKELDAYVDSLLLYRKGTLDARNNAAAAWSGLTIRDSGTALEIKPAKYSENGYSIKLLLHLEINNTTPWKLIVPYGKYQWQLSRPSGQELASGEACINGASVFHPEEHDDCSKTIYLDYLSKNHQVLEWLRLGAVLISVYPSELKIAGNKNPGVVTPDGSPFPLPQLPKMPFWASQATDKHTSNEMEIRFHTMVEQQIEAQGGPPPLPAITESTFARPHDWFRPQVVIKQ